MGPEVVPVLRGHSPTQPRCSSAREGALPAGLNLTALNDQPSCRIPRGVGVPECSGNLFSFGLAKRNVPIPFPRPRAWGNFLKNPK